MRRRSLVLAAALACAACGDAALGPAATANRSAVFDELWQGFDLHYSFFVMKNVNWDSVGAHYRPLAIGASSDVAFGAIAGQMLAELRDVHVSLTPGGVGNTIRYLSRYDTIPTYFDSNRVFARYVTGAQATSGLHMRYGMTAPGVGYVRIASFAGADWGTEMDEVLAHLPDATSLIVDIRDNPGGTTSLAPDIAGRFTDAEQTYGYVRLRNGPAHTDFTDYIPEAVVPTGARRFSGRVFVLTNRRDFSTAEDFVLAMRALPYTTVVGDTTAGASGGPLSGELSNGWTYRLSGWIEYTPSHRTFEGIGLAPDVVVQATAANAAQGVDAALEHARAMAQGG